MYVIVFVYLHEVAFSLHGLGGIQLPNAAAYLAGLWGHLTGSKVNMRLLVLFEDIDLLACLQCK